MARQPGKKLRTEEFQVDGRWVGVEIRILDDGKFYAFYGEETFKFPTMVEMRKALEPIVERENRLKYEPIIVITCHDADDRTSRWHHGRESNAVEALLAFTAGWRSTTPIGQDHSKRDQFRFVTVPTDADATEVARPPTFERRDYGDKLSSGDRWVPFTAERWRSLGRIREAMLALRVKIAEVMADESGKTLDAVGGGLLLGAAPQEKR